MFIDDFEESKMLPSEQILVGWFVEAFDDPAYAAWFASDLSSWADGQKVRCVYEDSLVHQYDTIYTDVDEKPGYRVTGSRFTD